MKKLLKFENSWEYHNYYMVDDGKKHLIVRMETIYIEEGDELKMVPVFSVRESVSYDDMGHTYNATSLHYYAKVKIFGIEHKIPLKTLAENPKLKIYVEEKDITLVKE